MNWEGFEPAKEVQSWTDEIECTSSEFALSSAPIRYFLTNVRLASLEGLFDLVEDIPGSSHWGYDAIFQRDIDDDRVDKELLKKYLLRQDKFKFFNPLTIALLPWNATDNQMNERYRTTDLGDASPQDGSMNKKLLVGGVEVQLLTGATVGKIRWDRREIKGVAIDGQHRLSALMKYAKHSERPPGINPHEARIPVTLLVFDTGSNVLTQVREIFVDINKNAEPVSTSRRILLDDRDPYAVLTRDLISDQHNQNGLRYEVIDWKREAPRPEGGNQLTTTVVLYEIVKRILSVGQSGSPITRLVTALDLNGELSRKNLQTVPVDDENFGLNDLSDKQLEIVRQRFAAKHKKLVLYVLQNVSDYKEFLELVSSLVDSGTEESEYLREYILKPSKKREAVRTLVSDGGYDPKAVIDKPFKALVNKKTSDGTELLLFTSVGQQALFFELPKVRKLYEECGYPDLESVAEQYVEDLNLLSKNGLFDRTMSIEINASNKPFKIWERICLRGEAKLAPGQASVKRMSSLILLILCALRHDIVEDFQQAPLNLGPNVKLVKDEYVKEWRERMDNAQYLSQEQSDIDEDDEEYEKDEMDDEEDVEELALATISKVLETVRSWNLP